MKKYLIVASIVLLGFVSSANALTGAGVAINNTATLSYSVGALPQSDINASDAGFVVDRKIDIIVASTDPAKTVNTTPSSSEVVLTFQVANSGNDDETFNFSTADISGGDDFNPNSCLIYDNAAPLTAITSLPITAETNVTILVKCDMPPALPAVGGISDGDNGTIVLTAAIDAATRPNHTADADIAATIQNVYADGAGADGDTANNGAHADQGTYHIVSPDISMVKSSIVISDPVNTAAGGTTPHRIPGATVRYCFTVDNNGSADATSVNIVDDFTVGNKDSMTYVNSGFIAQSNALACDCAAVADTSGSFATPDVTIPVGTITSAPATARICAYIEATID